MREDGVNISCNENSEAVPWMSVREGLRDEISLHTAGRVAF